MNNTVRPHELPLLGSNQDSPDPESAASLALRLGIDPKVCQFPTISASSSTNRHTIRHPSERHCARCETTKPLSEFGVRTKRGKSAPQPYCRTCMVDYHREWRATERGEKKFRAKASASRARYPERQIARVLLRRAITAGRVVRGPCCLADATCAGGIDGHHDDYSKPLEVRWVCRKHHRVLDRERRANPATSVRVPRAQGAE